MGLTDDPNNPCIREVGEDGMQECYLVLSEEERTKGFVRPVRTSYVHERCGSATTMAVPLAETYARDPRFYTGTYCAKCRGHFPVGEHGEFVWAEPRAGTPLGQTDKVGT